MVQLTGREERNSDVSTGSPQLPVGLARFSRLEPGRSKLHKSMNFLLTRLFCGVYCLRWWEKVGESGYK